MVVLVNVILIVLLPTANDDVMRYDAVRFHRRFPFDDQFGTRIGVRSQIRRRIRFYILHQKLKIFCNFYFPKIF